MKDWAEYEWDRVEDRVACIRGENVGLSGRIRLGLERNKECGDCLLHYNVGRVISPGSWGINVVVAQQVRARETDVRREVESEERD
jgi:hypothetical protein